MNKIIKNIRLSLGFTQKQIANAIGVTHQAYQAYEAGISVPTLRNFLKLCELFDVTPNELLDIDF